MICPYCAQLECDSDDHIFLQAIGGRRTIPACRTCNSAFGRTFEAQAVSTILHPLLVQLAGVGVPLVATTAKWKRATTGADGQVYDAVIDEGSYKLESTRPFVQKDEEDPKKFHVRVGDDRVGRKHLKQFLNEDQFRVLSTERYRVDVEESTHNWGFTPAIKLTALKMAFAVGAIAFPEEVSTFTLPRKELGAALLDVEPQSVQSDQRDLPALDALRLPLSHVIYVEQKDRSIQAFVQFFGALQFWIELSPGSLRSHGKAILKPVLLEISNQIVSDLFEEAHEAFLYGFDSASIALCRSLVDHALRDRLTVTNTLQFLIQEAVNRGLFDALARDCADKVRDAGNKIMHDKANLRRTAEEVLDCTRIVLNKLYGKSCQP